jgi:hypothetical protein
MSRFHNDRATEGLAIYSHGLAFGIFAVGAVVHAAMAYFHYRAVGEHRAHLRELDVKQQEGGRA